MAGLVIDVHGHLTSPPAALQAYRASQITSGNKPRPFNADSIPDEQLVRAVTGRQLKQMELKGIDRLILSPHAVAMGHHFGGELISRHWAQACNDLIHRVCKLFPDKLSPSCQLPQSPGVPLCRNTMLTVWFGR